MNKEEGVSALPKRVDFRIYLDNTASFDKIAQRLRAEGLTVEAEQDGLVLTILKPVHASNAAS